MKTRNLAVLFTFLLNTGWADFSDVVAVTHPGWPSTAHYLPAGVPYLIELNGKWSTDCHPGEQKPIIIEYTGDSALIEFETIIEHVTCNDVVTPFRVLIDMSDVFGGFDRAFGEIEITVRFGGSEYIDTLMLSCPVCSPPPIPWPPLNPEPGLYYSNGLEKQGLLLARQNQRMGAYPLIYDESGSSEWLIGAGGITEDVFFAELMESTGGQCLGCPPPEEPPQMGVVGKISMLMDSEGVIQVKINDGLFETYEPLEFGYGSFEVSDKNTGEMASVPNLSGRWAFTEIWDHNSAALVSPAPTSIIPLVFDIALPSTDEQSSQPVSEIRYSVLDIEGEEVIQMSCHHDEEVICAAGDMLGDWFPTSIVSPERIHMVNGGPLVGGMSQGSGTAVRID